ncbi:hypothetical protein DSM112329_04773 [Paraconexibacter sp. AEG42_29]|uniref:DUF3320 domain-containing protein n=1 Tax=Paraconexibacter sp. AEG42_29 TaxID=2997339 RepID=A0AAU7B1Y3_9ACTN
MTEPPDLSNAKTRAQVEQWRDDLLDLSGRNRLLRFRHNKVSSLEVRTPSAQSVLDRLITGRAGGWRIFIPDDHVETPDVDPTVAVIGVGGPRSRPGEPSAIGATVRSLAGDADAGAHNASLPVHLTLGAIQWRDYDVTRAATVLHVGARIRRQGSGWRLILEDRELRMNVALLAHFEREYGVTLGSERGRLESAGIADFLQSLRTGLAAVHARVDDRVGLIDQAEHDWLLAGELDLTPRVLITTGPRDGILGGLVAAGEGGLPLIATNRVLQASGPPPRTPNENELETTKRLAKDVRAAAAALDRRATQEFMDKGLWVLYLGVGMLHWSDPADGRAEFQDSPLLLVPVRLSSLNRGAGWKLEATEDEPLVNPALWLKLENELEIELPPIDEGEPIDVAELLGHVREATGGHPEWTVEERVVLSTFSFHKEVMYRDLRDNLETIVEHPVVASLARDPATGPGPVSFDFEPVAEDAVDTDAPPERVTTILDADASQRQCILAARAGHSFVMDGPPGTGKSQTIANMIAELIADGKTVLFVSEKAAALDVVHNRLSLVGLDEYVLELHSHKTTRPVVAKALGASLMRKPRPMPKLSDGDLRRAGERREGLTAYTRWLNTPLPEFDGQSLHSLLGQIAELQHLPQAPIARERLSSADEVATVREAAKQLRANWSVVERGANFEWRETTIAAWGAGVEQRVLASLEELEAALAGLAEASADATSDLALDPVERAGGIEGLIRLLVTVGARPGHIEPRWLGRESLAQLAMVSNEVADRAGRRMETVARLHAQVGAAWPRFSPPTEAPSIDGLPLIHVELNAAGLRRLAQQAQDAGAALDILIPLARDAAAQFGLQTSAVDLNMAARLVELHAIAASAARPNAAWLADATSQERAREAVRELRPKLELLREVRAGAQDFEESVLELDLVELKRRFTEEHTGFSKLGAAYRTDRDLLAATAPGLKPKEAIARLDHALAWRAAHRELAASTAAIDALVDAWSGIETDLDRLELSTSNAARALELAGSDIADPRRFASVVGGGAGIHDLQARRRSLDDALAPALAETAGAAPELQATELRELRAGLTETAVRLVPLQALVEHADIVRGSAGTLASAVEAVAARGALDAVEHEHAERHDTVIDVLGERWSTIEPDVPELLTAVEWARSVRSALDGPARPRTAELLATATVGVDALETAWRRYLAAEQSLLTEFEDGRRADLRDDLRGDHDDALALMRRLRDERGDIEVWIGFARAKAAIDARGLAEAVAFCERRPVSASDLVDVLLRAALESVADDVLGRTQYVLTSSERDRLVREFAEDDRRVIADANHRVMAAANARRPNTILGVAAVIQSEAAKKRRHMPVAELLKRTALVAQALKPCFMMSPLSVSQFLSPEMRFDVVIFDEASQVTPSDAVNALYRGRAMIVAGDQKQLPPTNFFQQTTDESDEWTDESLKDFDSVLDLAKGAGAYRSLSLRWHYRSRHEHLIAFSNHRFYGGELVTFPGPVEESDALGVALVPVEGVYRRGTSRDNPVEAAAIVDRIFFHADAGSRSIGVVAFSEAQASYIEELLRRDARREDEGYAWMFAEDRLGGLFVKNLENVQGDERDVILFSVGYGPDENGKLTNTFGPLNRDGGWRRLNVAVTRARRRVEIVCSFSPELMPPSTNRGVTELARYLDYAARGPVALAIDVPEGEAAEVESPFEDAVLRVVRGWGYDVVPQVGTAGFRVDLGVRSQTNARAFSLGIECDGAMYHSSRTARDRDRLRQEILEGLGWSLHRIWGPSWYRDRPGEEARLKRAIERAQRGSFAPSAVEVDLERRRPDLVYDELDLDAPPVWSTPYRVAALPFPQSVDVTPSAASDIRRFVMLIVEDEGPITDDLLIRRTVGAWDVSVTERRRRTVDSIVNTLVGAKALVREPGYLRLPEQTSVPVRVPSPMDDRTRRDVKHVPIVELAEALVLLATEAGAVDLDDLQAKAARIYGWARRGPAIQNALERAIDALIREDRLVRASDGTVGLPTI